MRSPRSLRPNQQRRKLRRNPSRRQSLRYLQQRLPQPKQMKPRLRLRARKAKRNLRAYAPAGLDAPKGEADDLKKIGGVGPKLEGTLNELGIYHFWQIAEFTPDNVAWVDGYLSFKGRIERDDWIGQAKAFAAEADATPEDDA